MSSMKDAYLKQLRPMDGQQADTPTLTPAPAETDSAQQTLFPASGYVLRAIDEDYVAKITVVHTPPEPVDENGLNAYGEIPW